MDLEFVKDALAKSYFKKFLVRVEVLPEYHEREAYSDVIREGQEALELFTKALLRHLGVEPSHSHDPGRELSEYLAKVPSHFQKVAPDIIKYSRRLRKDRELAFYGAKDFVPTESYSEEEAAEVLDFLEALSKLFKKWNGS